MRRILLGLVLLPLLFLSQSPAADPEKPARAAVDTEALAHRLWALTDLVLENHIDPPARQEMLQAGIKALAKKAGALPPVGLGRRISQVVSEKEFAVLLRDVWPKDKSKQPVAAAPLEDALVNGMLRSVPGGAHVYPPMDQKRTEQISGNRYEGTGVQIGYDNSRKLAKIITPIRRGPLHRAGARPGDLILKVDDVDAHNVGLYKVVSLLQGKAGTPVTVVVRQPGAKEARTLKIKREVIPFENIQGYHRASGDGWEYRADKSSPIAYVVVKSITASTLHELRKAERRIKADGLRALVLDLRFCSGGTFLHAVQFTDGLLDGGVMFRIRDAQNRLTEYRADRDCLFRDWPLVVLVGEFSSTMSVELFAAALQDNHRAVLVGEPSKGDGYINRIVPVPGSKELLRVRSARTERASAADKPWALQPDHKVAMTPAQKEALQTWLAQKDWTELPAGTTNKPPEDPQLAKALEVLRASLKDREVKKPGKADAPR